MHKDMEERVIQITCKILNIAPDKISPNSDFTNDLGADSLDQLELIMALEAEFNCDIADEEAAKIRTIKDAVTYIQNNLSS